MQLAGGSGKRGWRPASRALGISISRSAIAENRRTPGVSPDTSESASSDDDFGGGRVGHLVGQARVSLLKSRISGPQKKQKKYLCIDTAMPYHSSHAKE